MRSEFIFVKFTQSGEALTLVRSEVLPNKKIITFHVAITDLSTLQFDHAIDFDKESDALIENHKQTRNNITFAYIPNFGFNAED